MIQSPTQNALAEVYSTDLFRNLGHQLIDLIANHVDGVQTNLESPVLPYKSPAEELAFWQNLGFEQMAPLALFQQIIDHSINVHHPRYIGHQVAKPSLVASLAGLVADVMSNGSGVYEMGMSSNAIEKVVTDWVAQHIGFDENASGIITSGGSLANLTGLLAARRAKAPNSVWEDGHDQPLALLVSEEAHYCVDRAARIMGLGSKGIIKVPVDRQFKIRTDLLSAYLEKAKAQGLKVIAVVGCAASTATGSYDDLNALADFCQQEDLWLHVDGAHGGAVVFSQKYKSLAQGIERADSVVIDFHKMLLTPSLNTALIFKTASDSYKTFAQKAQYLWDAENEPEWYHSGKRTFECTKLMLSIKSYAILKTHGTAVFGENVDRLYDLGRSFAAILIDHPHFELAVEPEGNIVNFRYINASLDDLDALNHRIRQQLIESGKFYIVQTTIHDNKYLRTAIMNPLTTEREFYDLLEEIEVIAAKLSL